MKNGSVVGFGIVGITAFITGAIIGAIRDSAERNSMTTCEEKAQKKFEGNRKLLEDAYNEATEALNKLKARETDEFNKRMNMWEETIGYKAAMSALDSERDARIDDIKNKEFKYDETVADIKKKAADSVEDWKVREDYNGKLADIEAKVNEAKSNYSNQKVVLSLTNTTSGANDELLKVAKDEKKRKLDELNTKKQKLESDLRSFKNSTDSIANRDIRNLKDNMDKRIKEVQENIDSRAQTIRATRTNEVASVLKDIRGNRTEEENGYELRLNDIEQSVKKLNDDVTDEYNDLRSKQTNVKMVAELLRDKYEWTPSTLVCIGSVPVIASLVGIGMYLSRIFEIARAMKEEC